MAFSDEKLNTIYARTIGTCHICRKNLTFKNYGRVGSRGAWEVEHSKPRSNGGSDHGNNLYAACITCNRRKNNSTTQTARRKNGYKGAPFSKKRKMRNAIEGAGVLGTVALLFAPPQIKVPVMVLSAVVGGLLGYDEEPD